MKLLKKECFNRWYSLMPYYTALTLSRIPFQVIIIQHFAVRKIQINSSLMFSQILFNLIFLSLTYYMSGLPADFFRFGLFAIVGLMVSFVAEGMGLAIGATFSITVKKKKTFPSTKCIAVILTNCTLKFFRMEVWSVHC